jgi:hypothetical protein
MVKQQQQRMRISVLSLIFVLFPDLVSRPEINI